MTTAMANESPSSDSTSSTFTSMSWHRMSPRSSLTIGTFRRTQNVLLVTLASVLLLTVVQVTLLSQISAYIVEPETLTFVEHDTLSYSRRLNFALLDSTSLDSTDEEEEATTPEPTPAPTSTPKKYAVINFVADNANLWGIYSLHTQMKNFGMLPKIKHVVLVASDMKKKHKDLLRKWLGKKQVIIVDESAIRDKVPAGMWSTDMLKIEIFNLTQYDKVIGLDSDVFLRQNIAHWFHYPAPAATQTGGTIEWNSGAMVIEPNEKLYKKLLKYVRKTKVWNMLQDGVDGYQGLLSSFFLSRFTHETMHTMSYGASVLSSDLMRMRSNDYFWKYLNNAIETVHFTTEKPWKGNTEPSSPVLCRIMKDWMESVSTAPKAGLPELPNVLRNCKPDDLIDTAPASKEEMERAERKKRKVENRKRAVAALVKRRAERAKGVEEAVAYAPTPSPIKSTTKDICFVTSAYGSSNKNSTVPPSVFELQQEYFLGSKFYLFTNKNDLVVPGWTIIAKHFDNISVATQSRWPKFMAWQEPIIQECPVVFYLDGNLSPDGDYARDFLQVADMVRSSPTGMAQYVAPRKATHTLLAELQYISRTQKDKDSNVQAAKEWFQSQSDFKEQDQITIYDNSLVVYDPNNAHVQSVTSSFWSRYSLEQDIRQDQPLWAYTVSKLGVTPTHLGGKKRRFFAYHLASEQADRFNGTISMN